MAFFRAMECSPIPAKVIASSFALTAFAGAVIVGMAVGNSTSTVLLRAMATMGVCLVVGYIVGMIVQRMNDRGIAAYKEAHPLEQELPAETPSAEQASVASGSGSNVVV